MNDPATGWDYFVLLLALIALGLAIYNTVRMKMEVRRERRERWERWERERAAILGRANGGQPPEIAEPQA